MTSVRPLPLGDTTAKAGYDHIDPFTQWFLGGNTAPAATATGISDDDRYGLDLQNSGVGGFSFRAFSGNGAHFGRIDNTGVTFGGTFSVTGTGLFSGAMSVASLTVASGVTVTTGAVVMGGSATVANGFVVTTGASTLGGSLSVVGAATVGTLRSTGAATMASTLNVLSTIDVTGTANFRSSLQVDSVLNVTGVANFQTMVTVVGALNGTGVATFISTVTGSQFISRVAQGSAPFSATSTTLCPNLNAAYLSGVAIGGLIAAGQYTGDGNHNRTIALGFQPAYVFISCNGGGTDVACHLLGASSGVNMGLVRVGTGSTFLAMIDETYLTATGFQVDATGVNGISNTSGDTYNYAAWRTVGA